MIKFRTLTESLISGAMDLYGFTKYERYHGDRNEKSSTWGIKQVRYHGNKYYRINIFTGYKSLYRKLTSGVYIFSPGCKY